MPSCSLMTNDRLGLLMYSPVRVPPPMSGTETGTDGLAAVVNDTAPSAPPTVLGANFATARSTSPLRRVTGNFALAGVPPWRVTVTRPSVNGSCVAAALTEAPVTVTALVAVTLTCLLADEPTGVSPNCADPLR